MCRRHCKRSARHAHGLLDAFVKVAAARQCRVQVRKADELAADAQATWRHEAESRSAVSAMQLQRRLCYIRGQKARVGFCAAAEQRAGPGLCFAAAARSGGCWMMRHG